MSASHEPKRLPRKPYVAPAVERVVLDPIKEMLTSCATAPDSKLSGCGTVENFS